MTKKKEKIESAQLFEEPEQQQEQTQEPIEQQEAEDVKAEEKPKRKRRTKKEIEAEKAAAEIEDFVNSGEVTEHEKKEDKTEFVLDFSGFEPEINSEAAAQQQQAFEEMPDAFQEDKAERKSRSSKSKKAKPQVQYISGYMLLLAVDLIVPMSLNIMIPKTKSKNLKLTPEELANLTPFAEAAAAQMEVQMSPVTMFFLMAGTIYAGKII